MKKIMLMLIALLSVVFMFGGEWTIKDNSLNYFDNKGSFSGGSEVNAELSHNIDIKDSFVKLDLYKHNKIPVKDYNYIPEKIIIRDDNNTLYELDIIFGKNNLIIMDDNRDKLIELLELNYKLKLYIRTYKNIYNFQIDCNDFTNINKNYKKR